MQRQGREQHFIHLVFGHAFVGRNSELSVLPLFYSFYLSLSEMNNDKPIARATSSVEKKEIKKKCQPSSTHQGDSEMLDEAGKRRRVRI